MHSQCDYIVFAMRINNVQSKVKGFALIAAISVLLLLTLVAVAFLSLSAVTLKTSRFEWAQEEARANARLGLMIAIGELQRDLGPDQRIAVSASILDDNPDTADIDGVENRHWTGVMSSVFDQNSSGSPYTRDMNSGGLQDARGGTAYRAEDFILNYIVSGNEGGRDNIGAGRQYLNAQTETLQVGEDAVRIVSRGSASDPNDYVVVKTMTTEKLQQLPDGSESYNPKGRYAFWVSSANQKANVGRKDVHSESIVDETTGQGIQRLLHPLDTEPFVLEGVEQGQQVRDNRVLTPKSLTLISSENRDGVLRNYHAITGLSSSVLCNVRDGGLKKNLSAYLHGQDGDSAPTVNDLDSSVPYYIGISPQDRLIGPPNESFAQLRGEDFADSQYQEIAPTYELLWNWAQMSNDFSFGTSSAQTGIRPQKIWNNAPFDNGNQNIYDQQNLNPSDPRNLTDVKLTPVIAEACVYYNLATYPVGTGATQEHALRLCLYPRIGLWNPYNVDMELDRDMILQLFLNGKKLVEFDGDSNFTREIYYGGRSNSFDSRLGGQVYFTLPSVTIPAGQTFIFSMGGAPQELDINNIGNNVLQAQDAPSSSSYLFKDYLIENLSGGNATNARDDDGKPSEFMPTAPSTFREAPRDHGRQGADNYMFMLKYLDDSSSASDVTLNSFASLPALVYASISLQAGGSDEFANEWATGTGATVIPLTGAGDHVDSGINPHPFTRDGFRVRWLDETASNIGANNELFLQEAPLGNWNLRASYICRNPYDSVTSTQPYFHGIYTRDNPGDEVSWDALTPRLIDGFQTGFPFGPAGFGVDTVIAYEVPTQEVGIPSLAYLRHLQLSEYVWHPSYAIGSSLADPKVEITGTTPVDDLGGNHGWDTGGNGYGTRYWTRLFSDLVFYLAEENHLIFDMSYEVNHNLWSDYFLTGATSSQITNFAQDPIQNPLKNGNLRIWDGSGDPTDDLNDFFRAAGRLMMDGGFDVHSVNIEAWKALLATTRDTGYASQDRTPYPRTLFPKNDENNRSEYSTATFTGYRSLGDQEISALANEIVRQVKLRAPFFGMSDFVNRRLADDETGTSGTIEAALQSELSGITAAPNRGQNDEFPIADQQQQDQGQLVARPSQGETTVVMGSRIRTNQQLKPASRGYGTPGYITQGDVLQVIGSGLVARSDTFTVRSYGESVDVNGTVLAKAWCEATVQRTPEPIAPDDITGMNPRIPQDDEIDFGRRFKIVSFRWLSADEV